MALPDTHDRLTSAHATGLKLYRLAQSAVVTCGLAAMMAITVPERNAETAVWLTAVLWSCLGYFVSEFLVKSWIGARDGGILRYWQSSIGVIDLLAIVPIPIVLAAGVAGDTAWLLACLWVFKLAAFVPGLSMLGRIIKLEARPLASVLIIFLIVLLFAGVALHLLERAGQPQQFGSLPSAMWWAVTTLTTTGYGDAVPQTLLGRVIAGAVMICGLGVFGLWTGILATGFAAEHRRREFMRNWGLVTGVPFLRNLDAPAIVELTRLLRHMDLAERSVVVRRGRPGDCMYFIAAGEVEVQVEPKPVLLGAGSFFGEFALLDGGPRSATVMTTVPSTLLVLDVTDFRAFTAHHPELARQIKVESERRKSGSGGPDEGAPPPK
ncbi:MAG TPA: cyclic nucleotide-gated ion channel [Pseudolabrys sp.]|nr:cyclic nucleotide-gated ion channel [Pseudolabrys sp.]